MVCRLLQEASDAESAKRLTHIWRISTCRHIEEKISLDLYLAQALQLMECDNPGCFDLSGRLGYIIPFEVGGRRWPIWYNSLFPMSERDDI